MTRTSPRLPLALLLTFGLLLGIGAPRAVAATGFSPRVIDGTDASITDVPYQVALVVRGKPATTFQFCGGSIRDETHVITAAHCVTNLAGQVVAADSLDILAGTARLDTGGQRIAVQSVGVHPDFDRNWMTYDVAVLTLAQPLTLGDGVQPVSLVSDEQWAATPAGQGLRVSGWGATASGERPTFLQAATVPLRPDPFCDAQYDGLLTTELMLCAGDGIHDSCNGDSGGPLALNVGSPSVPSWRLAGVVSFGGQSGCASDTEYGVYTEVAAPRIRAFILTGSVPAGTTDPPASNPQTNNPPVTETNTTPTTTSVPPAAPILAPSDTVAPVAAISKATCTRTRCVLDLRVVDAGYSRGLRSVDATVLSTYRTRCRRGGRTVACTKTRTRRLKATRISTGRYRLVASGLPAGRHAVTVRATDAAGNRQIVAARRTLRTPARR